MFGFGIYSFSTVWEDDDEGLSRGETGGRGPISEVVERDSTKSDLCGMSLKIRPGRKHKKRIQR